MAFLKHPQPPNPPLSHSVEEIDFKVTGTTRPVDHRIRDCKVVIEDIAIQGAAAKLHTLNHTQEKTHLCPNKQNNSADRRDSFDKMVC